MGFVHKTSPVVPWFPHPARFQGQALGKTGRGGEENVDYSLATCYTKILYPMFAIPKTKEKENPYARSGNQSILRLCLH